jgi:hypothetical protein
VSLLTPTALADLRERDVSDLILLVAFAVGIALTTFHPAGLVVGGALAGLLAPSLRRAFLYALYFGGTVLLVFVAVLFLFGTADRWAGLGQLTLLSVGLSFGLPVLGAGVRGLV